MFELKPCPFCGGEAILETVDGNSPEECYIYCPECDFESGVYSEPKFIVEKWNRRTKMAEYIERTEELILAMNAGARAIENTKRYHGAVYTKNVFSESPQEIPYLQAAKVLRETSDTPAADAAPVVRCKDCKWFADNNDGSWYGCWLFQTIQIIPEDAPKPDDFCSYGERRENNG